ncbi:hypothetical protein MTO96_019628 [Rhipicephalus appendiculatus]
MAPRNDAVEAHQPEVSKDRNFHSRHRYLHRHFNPHDKATPAFITISGASTFDIENELVNIPRSVTTLVFHVGASELELYGPDESLRRLRRLVNNTLRTRQELQRLIVSCVLPRYHNRRLERSNENFVHRFNRDARHFNETIKAYCRKPGKVSYVDHEFDQLPPRRFLAADGLHPSFMGVALIAETLKGALCRRDLEVATGWSSQPTAPTQVRSMQENLYGTNTTSQQHIPGTLHTPDITAEFPTIAESVTPRRSMQPVVIESSTTPLRKVKPAEEQRRVPLLQTPTQVLPANTDMLHSTLTIRSAPGSSLQRRRPTGHTYNLRTPAMPSPRPKED